MGSDNRKVAIVTGANRGIGFEVCRQLSQLNITTILTSRDENKGKRAADDLIRGGAGVIFHQLDVADPASINRLMNFVSDEFERCDILVNNAGVFLDRGVSILELPEEMLIETLEINFIGALRICQAFLLEYTGSKAVRVIHIHNLTNPLDNNRTVIIFIRTEMHSTSANLTPGFDDGFMNMMAIHAFAAKSGQQSRMNIHNTIFIIRRNFP